MGLQNESLMSPHEAVASRHWAAVTRRGHDRGARRYRRPFFQVSGRMPPRDGARPDAPRAGPIGENPKKSKIVGCRPNKNMANYSIRNIVLYKNNTFAPEYAIRIRGVA